MDAKALKEYRNFSLKCIGGCLVLAAANIPFIWLQIGLWQINVASLIYILVIAADISVKTWRDLKEWTPLTREVIE